MPRHLLPRHLLPRHLRIVLLGGLALVVAAGLGWVAYANLAAPRQDREVAVPPEDATPEQVVAAFLDALDAHDCDTATALATSRAQDSAELWCRNLAGLGDAATRQATLEDPHWSGHAAPTQVMRVPVSFDLDWRPLRGDGSLPEGRTEWGYLLARDAADAPWRIVDQGMG